MQCPSCNAQVAANATFCAACGAALPKASNDARIGTTLAGRYRIVSKIGEGGMGAVFVAEQPMGTKTRKVAIKTLHDNLSQDPSVRERFQRECAIVSELEHPHTIQVFDFGTTEDGTLYIVMELAQGKSLADVITKDGALEPARAKAILTQIGSALGEAHRRGIIHRDLKPDNVLLTQRAGENDFVKLLDFGIAKRSQEDPNEAKLTQAGTVIGTPPYMSPEQFTGQALSPASDIYSLGVMAYEMVTGKLPFHVDHPWQWATKHMTETPAPIETMPNGSAVPDAMRKAIARALEKVPEARFATTKDFVDALSIAPKIPTATDVPATVPDGVKGKTQIGEAYAPPPGAFAPAPAYGAPPAASPDPSYGAPTPGAYGSPPANYAAPAHSYVASPPTSRESGGSRKGILIAAAVIGVLSLGAVGFALSGSFSPASSPATPIELTSPATPTTQAASPAAPAPTETTAPVSTTTAVAPLSPGAPQAPAPARPSTPSTSTATPATPPAPTNPAPAPTATTPTAPQPPAVPAPTTPAPPATIPPHVEPRLPQPAPQPAPPAAVEIPACKSAAAARARGMTGPSYEALVAKCRAAGGNP